MTDWQVQEALDFIKKSEPLQIYLDFDVYNKFAKRKMRGIYDHNKALKDLLPFIKRVSHHYYMERGNVSLYNIPESDKIRICETILNYLEESDGFILTNIPLNEITDVIPLRKPLDLSKSNSEKRLRAFTRNYDIREKSQVKKGYSELVSDYGKHHLCNKT